MDWPSTAWFDSLFYPALSDSIQVLFTCGEDTIVRCWDLSDPENPRLTHEITDSFRRSNTAGRSLIIHRDRLFVGTNTVKMFM
jgi:hypothetical protein